MSETPTKKKKRILSPVKQKYKKDYTDTWPCFTKSKLSEHHVYCQTCRADIKIAHGGKIDCRKHVGLFNKQSVSLPRTLHTHFTRIWGNIIRQLSRPKRPFTYEKTPRKPIFFTSAHFRPAGK